jgi:xanthine permease XanP
MDSERRANPSALSLRERFATMFTPKGALEADRRPRKKPSNLVYDVDEVPPLLVQIGASIQHIFLMSVGWLYIVVIVNSVGGGEAATDALIRMSMVAGGIATILQANKFLVGSGYFCPLSGSLTFLQPSILAVRTGGFSLLFGMVAAAGIFTSFLSFITSRLRVIFPPEVTGLMVAMSGLQLVSIALPRFAGVNGAGGQPDWRSVAVGAATLFIMIAATVWNRGRLHVLPILAGVAAGYGIAKFLGIAPTFVAQGAPGVHWFGLPHLFTGGRDFRLSLLLPFLIAGLTASLKTVGDITLCQKINDEDWKRTDMRSVSGGLFANGIGTFISGLLGGVAQNTVSSSVGLSVATGTTSRSLALPTGLIVIALAFFPRLVDSFASMPVPVMGAMLIYSACFIVVGGFQLLTSRMLDARRVFAVGVSLIFGLSVEISPEIYRSLPDALRPIFSSSTSLATVLIVLLSLLFRIGISKQHRFSVIVRQDPFETLHKAIKEQGSAWGMRPEVALSAEQALHELIASIATANPLLQEIDIELSFDELRLTASAKYDGIEPVLAEKAPTIDELVTPVGVSALSGFMIRQFADQVRFKQIGLNSCLIQLTFDH